MNANTHALGVDVSHYQGVRFDWQTWVRNGIVLCFIKATQNLTYVDPVFAHNWQAAGGLGLLRGAYHYFENAVDAAGQAQHFMDIVDWDHGELPLVVDVEDTTAPLDGDQLLVCLQAIETRMGHKPILYPADWFWDAAVHWKTATKKPIAWARDYDLWVESTVNPPVLPSDWTAWRFWQHIAPDGSVDRDEFNGSIADLKAYSDEVPRGKAH